MLDKQCFFFNFQQFGTITEYETDTVTPSMILNFDSRKSAEVALSNGKFFGESELEITWVTGTESGGGDSHDARSNGNGGHQSSENGPPMEDDEVRVPLAVALVVIVFFT